MQHPKYVLGALRTGLCKPLAGHQSGSSWPSLKCLGSYGKIKATIAITIYSPTHTQIGTDVFKFAKVAIKGEDREAIRPAATAVPHPVAREDVGITSGVYLSVLSV